MNRNRMPILLLVLGAIAFRHAATRGAERAFLTSSEEDCDQCLSREQTCVDQANLDSVECRMEPLTMLDECIDEAEQCSFNPTSGCRFPDCKCLDQEWDPTSWLGQLCYSQCQVAVIEHLNQCAEDWTVRNNACDEALNTDVAICDSDPCLRECL